MTGKSKTAFNQSAIILTVNSKSVHDSRWERTRSASVVFTQRNILCDATRVLFTRTQHTVIFDIVIVNRNFERANENKGFKITTLECLMIDIAIDYNYFTSCQTYRFLFTFNILFDL